MRAKIEIAFRRKVRAVWLDHGMALAAQHLTWKDAKPTLANEIAAENAGAETIRKALEHVRRIWFEPPDDCEGLREAAFQLFQESNTRETRLLLNWGMATAAYPFVGSVGEALGRLLKLQAQAIRSDVQRRLREQHGDRDFVNRITRYTISSFLDWGIIVEGAKRGIYLRGKTIHPRNADELSWLTEAVLISRGETQMPLSRVTHHPLLFPVALNDLNPASLRSNSRLAVSRQSLNEELISLSAK
jgi:hypothetical protein